MTTTTNDTKKVLAAFSAALRAAADYADGLAEAGEDVIETVRGCEAWVVQTEVAELASNEAWEDDENAAWRTIGATAEQLLRVLWDGRLPDGAGEAF